MRRCQVRSIAGSRRYCKWVPRNAIFRSFLLLHEVLEGVAFAWPLQDLVDLVMISKILNRVTHDKPTNSGFFSNPARVARAVSHKVSRAENVLNVDGNAGRYATVPIRSLMVSEPRSEGSNLEHDLIAAKSLLLRQTLSPTAYSAACLLISAYAFYCRFVCRTCFASAELLKQPVHGRKGVPKQLKCRG